MVDRPSRMKKLEVLPTIIRSVGAVVLGLLAYRSAVVVLKLNLLHRQDLMLMMQPIYGLIPIFVDNLMHTLELVRRLGF
jgi:hypothetical protein